MQRRWLALLAVSVPLLVTSVQARLQGGMGAGDVNVGSVNVHVVLTNDRSAGPYLIVRLIQGSSSTTVGTAYTNDSGEAGFSAVPVGDYHVEISGDGIQTTTSNTFEVDNRKFSQAQYVVVRQLEGSGARPMSTHSAMVSAADLKVAPKARRELDKANDAMAQQDYKKAKEHLDKALALDADYATAYNNLAVLYAKTNDVANEEQALKKAVSLDEHFAPALLNYGKLSLRQKNFPQAETLLQKEVALDPDNPESLLLLADAEYMNGHFDAAIATADHAHAASIDHPSLVHCIAARAYQQENRQQEALAEFKAFLNEEPKGPRADLVRGDIAKIQSAAPTAQQVIPAKLHEQTSRPGEMSLESLDEPPSFDVATDLLISPKPELPPTSWLPPDVDHSKPALVAGASCPYQQVIEGAGERVQELVANVERIAAVETILYERLDPAGDVKTSESRKFDYSAEVLQKPNVVLVDEYRSVRYDQFSLPDRIADKGFGELALVFHPSMRDGFTFTCEGLGEWHGEPAWLVRFQQREDRPNHLQAYRLGEAVYPVYQKGRAWITADNFTVVRIESDLIRPMPQIELTAEHMVSEYAPVLFHKTGAEFWLPQTADVYMYFRGQRICHKHSFDKYMLFSVETEEKVHDAVQDVDVSGIKKPEIPDSGKLGSSQPVP